MNHRECKQKSRDRNRMATPTCRFCYSYKPPGFIQPVCDTPMNITTMYSQPTIVNNSTQTNSSALLLATQQKIQIQNQSAILSSTLQSTINHAASINSTVYGQLLDLRNQRYVPYQPYVPEVIPESVLELQRMTANVGNTMPNIMRCKGSQSVTR
jgi:hypothetical protein